MGLLEVLNDTKWTKSDPLDHLSSYFINQNVQMYTNKKLVEHFFVCTVLWSGSNKNYVRRFQYSSSSLSLSNGLQTWLPYIHDKNVHLSSTRRPSSPLRPVSFMTSRTTMRPMRLWSKVVSIVYLGSVLFMAGTSGVLVWAIGNC